jgi:hypothetical protein
MFPLGFALFGGSFVFLPFHFVLCITPFWVLWFIFKMAGFQHHHVRSQKSV